jgi:CubicO group peptidase (beta-lactamase class C family)
MKKNLLKPVIIFIILLSVVVNLQAQKSKYSKEILEKIKQFENNLISWVKLDNTNNWNIYDRMRESHVNGVSIAVINNYQIEWVKSYGWADTAEKRPVTNQTLFQAASIGKSINGIAFMRLMQDKKIDLFADINNYLQSWKFPYDTTSHGKPIILAQILSHTAGLTVHGFDGYKWNEPTPTLQQILNGEKPANNATVRSAFEPGIKFQYSGGGYEISELLLEDVTHEPYETFIRKNVFRQLGMNASTYMLKPETACATAYRLDKKPIGWKYHIYPEKACGAGLWTTTTDLAKLIIEIQLSLKGISNKVLTKETTEFMLTPHLQSASTAFGFFINKKGDNYYFQHSGLNEGFSSQYYGSMKNGNGVVILTNSDNTNFNEEVINSIATVYNWEKFYPFATKKIITVEDSITNKYVGTYKFENSDTGPSIVKENGSLYLIGPGSPMKWKMHFTSTTEFFMLEAKWANQQFFVGENSKVKGFYILGDNYKSTVNKEE